MNNGPILIQGAMDVETEYMASQLEHCTEHAFGGYRFWQGTYAGKELVISRTDIGMVHAAAATALGIMHFHPSVVINQGLAGAHREELVVGDIIVGERCATIHDLMMPAKGKGEGSDPTTWTLHFNDVEDDAGGSDRTGDPVWVKRFCEAHYAGGTVRPGCLGSGDVFNREYDRITWIRDQVGEDCEDMESYAMYELCHSFGVPCVGVRLISNNELTGLPYDRDTGIQLQKFVLQVVEGAEGQ